MATSKVLTGKELVRALRALRGKVQIEMLVPEDVIWMTAEKMHLIEVFERYGDDSTGMALEIEPRGNFLRRIEVREQYFFSKNNS